MNERRPERRSTPRYPVDTRMFASIDGKTVCLRNISLQGVAIQASGLNAGGLHLLEINLNRQHVAAPVEILDCSGAGLLHARFAGLDLESERLINAYIAECARSPLELHG